MAVYDLLGVHGAPHNLTGPLLANAYDITGELVYPDDPASLYAMAFNVGCFYSEYFPCPTDKGATFYQRHRSIFNKYHIDIAGMSEWYNAIGNVPSSELMSEYFTAYYPDYVYPIEGAALTSAYSLSAKNKTIVEYQNQRPNAGKRYYQKCVVTFKGKDISCFLTHLDTGSYRSAQFSEFLEAVQNETYFVAVGDFNFTIQSVGDSEYNESIKRILDLGYHSAQNADHLFMTWCSGQTEETSTKHALDNIFTSSNIDITNVTVDTTKLTDGLCQANNIIIDHLPLIAQLTVH